MELFKSKIIKVVVFAPEAYAGMIRDVINRAGNGTAGNSNFSSYLVKNIRNEGIFYEDDLNMDDNENTESNERIETICPIEKLKDIISVIKTVHPDSDPEIGIYPVEIC